MSSVSLQQVHKRFGPVPVIHGIDIGVGEGEFVALVGPSGCGKSTVLRMIAGLETVSDGEIHIGTRDVTDLEPKDRNIAMVFQNYALYPHMTVADNMGFSLRHRGSSREEIDKRVRWAADVLGLEGYLQRYPRQLSGGQRQRVAMGRAIVRSPEVFLFDEPLSNLDAKMRVAMRSEIKGLHQRLGTTMIYVTHDQVEAMTMADRIVVMNSGRVEQAGAPLELYDQPANRFVAEFIGAPAMNLLDVRVGEGGRLGAGDEIIGEEPTLGAMAGRDVVFGIRPEHIAITPTGLPAKVELVEPMGAQTQVWLTLGPHRLTVMTSERYQAPPGTEAFLSLDMARIHLFDRETGKRLN